MMDEKVLKSISFPLKMLIILDKYATENGLSRADVVRNACDEFVKKYNLDEE